MSGETARERLRGLLDTDLSIEEIREQAREQAVADVLEDLDYDD